MSKKITILLIGLALIGAPLVVSAQSVDISNPGEYDTFEELIMGMIKFVTYIAIFAAVFAIIYGGFIYMTASGDPQKVQKGTQTIVYAIVGLIVAFSAYAIVKFFLSTVFGIDINL